MKFINLDKLVDSINNFKYLILDFIPNDKESYYKRIIISDRHEVSIGHLEAGTSTYKHFKMKEKQFTNLLLTLSKSIIFFLPAKRPCEIDGKQNTVKIAVNNEIIYSVGCN